MISRNAVTFTAVALGLSTFAVNPVQAELLLGLTTGNQVVRFDSASPGTSAGSAAISGTQPGESILGIDFRPATGTVLALGSSSRLYKVDPITGVATVVSATQFVPNATGNKFGFDFNPTVDRIRLTSDADQNLRLNPDTGVTAATDGTLAYGVGDTNAGQNPNVAEVAYTNNVAGATSTSLYDIDSTLNILAIQNANVGTLTTVGGLNFDTDDRVGFDISGATGTAYASLTAATDTTSQLFTVNLAGGVATSVGFVGGAASGIAFRGLTVLAPEPASITILGATLGGIFLRRRRA